MLGTTALRRRLAVQRTVVGMAIQLPCCEVVEMAALAGYDFVMLDAEHGALDGPAVVPLIRAADAFGVAALVRTPDSSPVFIQRVLDGGAAGVVVPKVNTAAVARQIVAAAKFAPVGSRGACATSRQAGHMTDDWPSFVFAANESVEVWVLVEDQQGVANIEEILGVPGLTAVVFGAFDLAQDLGLDGDVSAPQVVTAFDRVRQAAERAGVHMVCVAAAEPGGLRAASQRGARVILDGFDSALISSAFRRQFLQSRLLLSP